MRELGPVFRRWMGYFRWSDVKGSFEDLDKWLRHKIRCIVWRLWKRPRTRFRELCRRGSDVPRAAALTKHGRGSAGALGSKMDA